MVAGMLVEIGGGEVLISDSCSLIMVIVSNWKT